MAKNTLKVIFYSRTDRKIIENAIREIRKLDCVFAIDISGLEKKVKDKIGTFDIQTKTDLKKSKERTAAQKLVLERLKQVPDDAKLCDI